MKIALAADHAGFHLKEHLRNWLTTGGYEVVDFGTSSEASTDYPEYASRAGDSVASGACDRGVLVCYTGVGMSISANKIPGIRAALAANEETVQLTRLHNDANVLAIGARFTTTELAERYVSLFLGTAFEGGRHARRVSKIADIERAHSIQEQVTKA
jgi:ribose 5-phosphate isomerase B